MLNLHFPSDAGQFNNASVTGGIMKVKFIAAAGPYLAFVLVFAYFEAAYAQSADSRAATDSGLQEVVVKAQRRDERLENVPITINVTSGTDLTRRGVVDTQGLAATVSGLTTTLNAGQLQPGIRGVSSLGAIPGNFSNVAVYFDGLVISDQNGTNLRLPDIENVEVDKGPQGTLFGRNATGGAINIHTKNPSFDTQAEMAARYGSFDEKELSGWATGPLAQGKVAGSLAALYVKADGWVKNLANNGDTTGVENQYLHGKLLITPLDKLSVTLDASHNYVNDPSASLYTPYDRLSNSGIRYPGTVIPTQPWTSFADIPPHYEVQAFRSSVKVDADLDFAKFTSLTGYSRLTQRLDKDLSDNSLLPPLGINFSNTRLPTLDFTQEFNLVGDFTRQLRYLAGAFYLYDRAGHDPQVVNSGLPLYSKQITKAPSVFGEIYCDILDNMTLTLGARYSEERQSAHAAQGTRLLDVAKTWNKVTPRISALSKLTPDTNIYATYSEGFKSGGFNYTTFSNVPYDAETLRMYEIGIKNSGPRHTVSVSAFDYNYSGIQYSTFVGSVANVFNAARATLRGLDFDGRVLIVEGLKVDGNFSWEPKANYDSFPNAVLQVKTPVAGLANGGCPAAFTPPCGLTTVVGDASGLRVIRAPKFTGNLSVDYTKPLGAGELTFNTAVQVSSRVTFDIDQQTAQSPYTTLSAFVSYAFPGRHWLISLRGTNLTDKPYIVGFADTVYSGSVVYGKPRAVVGSFEYHF
jgi:iron complex outermembrane receptor protein